MNQNLKSTTNFTWSQTEERISFTIFLPSSSIKGKDIIYKQTSNHLFVKIKQQKEPIIDVNSKFL
jgi:hypothetical protein